MDERVELALHEVERRPLQGSGGDVRGRREVGRGRERTTPRGRRQDRFIGRQLQQNLERSGRDPSRREFGFEPGPCSRTWLSHHPLGRPQILDADDLRADERMVGRAIKRETISADCGGLQRLVFHDPFDKADIRETVENGLRDLPRVRDGQGYRQRPREGGQPLRQLSLLALGGAALLTIRALGLG